MMFLIIFPFFFSSRRRHTRSLCDWSSDVCSSDLVVQAALASKKKVIAGGPGNPPVVVDETADLANAARSIVAGASLDNNVICTDEKEVFVVDSVADQLLTAVARNGAYVIQPFQLQQLERAV